MHRFRMFGLAVVSALFALAVMAQGAFAAIEFDAKDFTEPIESQVTTAAPIVIAFIAAIFGLTMLIRWVRKRANEGK